MIRWFERSQVYVPSRKLDATGAELGRPCEDVWLQASDGVRLHGWFFPANPGSPRASLALLHLHGNAGNISHRLNFYQAWLSLGVNLFAFDYRGFGQSEGTPDEEGTYLDGQAAYRWLREKGFAPEQIVVLGKSLGGGIASELALREPIGGLILQNTFTSIPDIGAELFPFLPVRRLARIRYSTVEKLPRISVPILVAHSRDDRFIGIHHGQRNFAASREPKQFLELRGEHNDPFAGGGERLYLEGLDRYLRERIEVP